MLTDQGKEISLMGETIFALSEGWMDYAHLNSIDYTLNTDGEVDKLLVSMRNQSSVYQFDFTSGAEFANVIEEMGTEEADSDTKPEMSACGADIFISTLYFTTTFLNALC